MGALLGAMLHEVEVPLPERTNGEAPQKHFLRLDDVHVELHTPAETFRSVSRYMALNTLHKDLRYIKSSGHCLVLEPKMLQIKSPL